MSCPTLLADLFHVKKEIARGLYDGWMNRLMEMRMECSSLNLIKVMLIIMESMSQFIVNIPLFSIHSAIAFQNLLNLYYEEVLQVHHKVKQTAKQNIA